jgi:hypothetical protein
MRSKKWSHKRVSDTDLNRYSNLPINVYNKEDLVELIVT